MIYFRNLREGVKLFVGWDLFPDQGAGIIDAESVNYQSLTSVSVPPEFLFQFYQRSLEVKIVLPHHLFC